MVSINRVSRFSTANRRLGGRHWTDKLHTQYTTHKQAIRRHVMFPHIIKNTQFDGNYQLLRLFAINVVNSKHYVSVVQKTIYSTSTQKTETQKNVQCFVCAFVYVCELGRQSDLL